MFMITVDINSPCMHTILYDDGCFHPSCDPTVCQLVVPWTDSAQVRISYAVEDYEESWRPSTKSRPPMYVEKPV